MKSQKLIPDYWTEAKVELSTRDPILADIISRNHDYTLSSRGDLFRTLIRSIVGQQISVKSAAATWCKFENKVKRKIKIENYVLLTQPSFSSGVNDKGKIISEMAARPGKS